MAPSRGKGKARASLNGKTAPTSNRRAPRSTRQTKTDTSDVYQDMLAEVEKDDLDTNTVERPLKKRRVLASASIPEQQADASASGKQLTVQQSEQDDVTRTAAKYTSRKLQTVEASSEDEDEGDFAFEDVDLEQPDTPSPGPTEHDDGIEDISVSVDPTTTPKRRAQARRKPTSIAEKTYRLLVHKSHILCLLGHCMYINGWCNNAAVQRHLRSIIPKKTLSYLDPKTDESQFQKDRSFMAGLQQASELFRGHFKITTSGMKKASWSTDGEEAVSHTDVQPMDRSDFILSARELEGSQDTANQLFCALLRSAGVEARLVCSFQILPLANVSTNSNTPQKITKPTVYAMSSGLYSAAGDSNTDDNSVKDSKSIGKVPSVHRRLGQPSFGGESVSDPSPKKTPIRKLSYPVFWVEAFNAAHQKWVPVDPIITQSVNKPAKFEPPSSYDLNQMSYVVAFEDDGVARDVTRRYTRAYNAKTRRRRVESTENGAQWLRKALRIFRRRGDALDRDQVEDAELAQKEAREGLPNNVQDFKDHPYYALERHLKRHEVIHPRREVGKVNAGTAAKPRMEAVFRRQDVLSCRSADKWYRLGREVQKGEQPVKHVPARSRRSRPMSEEGDEEGATNLTALYAPYQTELYVPPPVVRGRIPRNAYGNLDIYVPSMVPVGGVHVRHQLAQLAAKTLRIDHADAVTGFQFKGRHGTAIVEGAVVAAQYEDAVKAVIEGFEDEQMEEESKARSALALKMWKRLLTGLRIAKRVSAYGDPAEAENIREELDAVEDEQEETAGAGGFLPADAIDEVALPTAGRFSLEQLSVRTRTPKRTKKKAVDDESEEPEFSNKETSVNDEDESVPMTRSMWKKRHIAEDDDENMPDAESPLHKHTEFDDGGGCVLDDVEDLRGGGFVVDDVVGDHGGGGFVSEDAVIHLQGDEPVLEDTEGFNPSVGDLAVADTAHDDLQTTIADGSWEMSEANLEMSGGLQDEARDEEFGQKQALALGALDVGPHSGEPTADGEMSGTNSHVGHVMDAVDEGSGNASIQRGLETGVEDSPGGKELDVDEDGQSDNGSMISHDPEDEDAEPDWLESD